MPDLCAFGAEITNDQRGVIMTSAEIADQIHNSNYTSFRNEYKHYGYLTLGISHLDTSNLNSKFSNIS